MGVGVSVGVVLGRGVGVWVSVGVGEEVTVGAGGSVWVMVAVGVCEGMRVGWAVGLPSYCGWQEALMSSAPMSRQTKKEARGGREAERGKLYRLCSSGDDGRAVTHHRILVVRNVSGGAVIRDDKFIRPKLAAGIQDGQDRSHPASLPLAAGVQ